MSDHPEGEEALNKLFALTSKVHAMATQDTVARLANHLATGAEMGHTAAIGVRIKKEGAYDGVLFLVCGPKVGAADAEAFLDFAKMTLQDIDPAAAKNFTKNE